MRWVTNSFGTRCALLLAGCAIAACVSAPAEAPHGIAAVVAATTPSPSSLRAIFARETVGIAALAGKNPNEAYHSAVRASGHRAGAADDDRTAH